MNDEAKDFKRLNFFTGFFTTADDWNDGETYHLEKRRLHNRTLHRPGILRGEADDLAVDATGGMCLRVKPGAALDGSGNLILVATAREVEVPPASGLAQTAYVYVRFAEQDAVYVENFEDPDFSGYSRKAETPAIQVSFNQPDGIDQVELARVSLLIGATEIKNPADPERPQANEVDRTHVHYAGARDSYYQALLTRLVALHHAYCEQQRRYNLGLHTPGVLPHVEGELSVHPVGGLTVRVEPGAALDAHGNELYLDAAVDLTLASDPNAATVHFVAVRYYAVPEPSLTDLEAPFRPVRRTARVVLTTEEPDQMADMQLARIVLSAGATEIHEPDDPGQPRNDEIDMLNRLWSKARGWTPERLPVTTQERVNNLMLDQRENLAALRGRFTTPSLEDARTAALQVRLAVGAMEPEQLPRAIGLLAEILQDVEEELGVRYPPLAARSEYQEYRAAVAELLAALRERRSTDALLVALEKVNRTVRDLSEVVFAPPVAAAGADQKVQTTGHAAKVTLDARGSQPAPGQRIVSYIWEEVAS